MTTLFNEVPEATMPRRAELPSKAQDLLTEYAMARQREYDLKRQLDEEKRELTSIERKLGRLLQNGDVASYSGISVLKAGKKLVFYGEKL